MRSQPLIRLLLALLAGLVLVACRGPLTVIEYGEPIPTSKVLGTAASKVQFTTVLSLLNRPEYTEIVNQLNKPEDSYTLFLPNNQAFENMDPVARKALFADTARLRRVLTYHLVKGYLLIKDMLPKKQAVTQLENKTVTFSGNAAGQLQVNDSRILEGDFKATNGVVHEIEKLLMPE
ncbi:MAG: fasciclin domain-containing protein [Candidatus Sericytochromatia bacterium]